MYDKATVLRERLNRMVRAHLPMNQRKVLAATLGHLTLKGIYVITTTVTGRLFVRPIHKRRRCCEEARRY
jgi:hypothetical protein